LSKEFAGNFLNIANLPVRALWRNYIDQFLLALLRYRSQRSIS